MASKALLSLAIVVALVCVSASGAPAEDDSTINVFVLPHSHDDVGWIRTYQQYYDDFVYYIYTTVVDEMAKNPDRRFQSVEQAYFYEWWNDKRVSDEQRNTARQLVAEGRLLFVVAGWVMPDEAAADYADLIETITIGHEFVYDTFGVVPRFSFEVDPFGTGTVLPWIFAKSGFDAHIISRINYWQKAIFQDRKELQFMWEPSPSIPDSNIFTYDLDQYSYCPPSIPVDIQYEYFCADPPPTSCPGGGFLWDGDCCAVPAPDLKYHPPYPGVNMTSLHGYALVFANNTHERADWFASNNLLWPFGCDFQWFNATRMYDSMDLIISYINANNGKGGPFEGIHVQYATLEEYFTALHADDLDWGTRGQDDFFPYTDTPGRTWSGYFTSHPEIKGYAREAAAFLRAVNMLSVVSGDFDDAAWDAIYELRKAVGVLQHHDAITGTMGPGWDQEATNGQEGDISVNYQELLDEGMAAATPMAARFVANIIANTSAPTPSISMDPDAFVQGLKDGVKQPVVFFNPTGWRRTSIVSLEIPALNAVAVMNADGDFLVADLINPGFLGPEAPIRLYFEATIPPLGTASFVIVPNPSNEAPGVIVANMVEHRPLTSAAAAGNSTTTTFSSDFFDVVIDTAAPAIANVSAKGALGNFTFGFDQHVYAYDSFFNASLGAVSGSYCFRPLGPPEKVDFGAEASYATGQLITEIQFQSAVHHQALRIPMTASIESGGYLEFDFAIEGPLPGNTEVVSTFQTSIENANGDGKSVFHTDNNGAATLQRVYNDTVNAAWPDPGAVIAGNFYPFVRSGYIADQASDSVRMALISSRSHGATSRNEGEMEVMLHRRLLQDDNLGACFHPNTTTNRTDGCPAGFIPHNLTSSAYPTLWMTIGNSVAVENQRRLLSQLMNNPTVTFYGNVSSNDEASHWLSTYATPTAGLQGDGLDPTLHLLTLRWKDANATTAVARVQNVFERGDVSPLAKDAVVDLSKLFSTVDVLGVEERSINLILPVANLTSRWTWKYDAGRSSHTPGASPTGALTDPSASRTVFTVVPQDILSFYLETTPPHSNPDDDIDPGVIVVLVLCGFCLVFVIGYLAYAKISEKKTTTTVGNSAVYRTFDSHGARSS